MEFSQCATAGSPHRARAQFEPFEEQAVFMDGVDPGSQAGLGPRQGLESVRFALEHLRGSPVVELEKENTLR